MAAGFAVLSGREWARWTGVGIAALSVIGQMPFAQAYPLWSLSAHGAGKGSLWRIISSKGARAMLCSLATELDQGQLDDIGTLEKDLGVPVLTFACHKVDPAAIDDAQIARIKKLESRLGVSLVAVKG